MKYILILTFISHYKGGVTGIEFNSLKACEYAGEMWTTRTNPKSRYICVPKGKS